MTSERDSSVNDGVFNASGLLDPTAKPPFNTTPSSINETDLTDSDALDQRSGIQIPNSESVHFQYELDLQNNRNQQPRPATKVPNPLFKCPCIHNAITHLVTQPDSFVDYIQPYFQNLAIYSERPDDLNASLSTAVRGFNETSICQKDRDLYQRLAYFSNQIMSGDGQPARRQSAAVYSRGTGRRQVVRSRGNSLPLIEGVATNLTFNELSELVVELKKSGLEDVCEMSRIDGDEEMSRGVGEMAELDPNERPLLNSTRNGEWDLMVCWDGKERVHRSVAYIVGMSDSSYERLENI